MPAFLQYQFTDSPEFISTFDELPLWSAHFGILLLKHVELRRDLTVLDIGSGAGFPLLELAQRLGQSSKCYGLDPWANANSRARQKIINYGITNAEITEGSAVQIPFDDGSIDLIVSNLGINNFSDPAAVVNECHRVLKPGGTIAITTNLNGHWQQFYDVFQQTVLQLNKPELLTLLQKEQEHRGSVASTSQLFAAHGIPVSRVFEETFEMKFADGSAFLNHYFVKLGWLGAWKELVPAQQQEEVFTLLEENLNASAAAKGGLTLTVPMAYIECKK